MRIFITLLVLLLSSSVFAETYVCSYVNDDDEITPLQFTRTAGGLEFEYISDNFGSFASMLEIIYEDSLFLVLHSTFVISSDNLIYTSIFQIPKTGGNRYKSSHLFGGYDFIETGTCTVVE